MLGFDSIVAVLAFGKNAAGSVLAVVGTVMIAAVLSSLLLRSTGWKP